MPTHKCPICSKVGEVTLEYWNFKCDCGYKTHLFRRRELMDLDDPEEGELAVKIAGESLKT
jgi:hypothetical protein